MNEPGDIENISYIIDLCEMIEKAPVRFGQSICDFKSDDYYKFAIAFAIYLVCLLADNISDYNKHIYRKIINWQNLYEIKLKLAYKYLYMTNQEVYDIMNNIMPDVKQGCDKILSECQSNTKTKSLLQSPVPYRNEIHDTIIILRIINFCERIEVIKETMADLNQFQSIRDYFDMNQDVFEMLSLNTMNTGEQIAKLSKKFIEQNALNCDWKKVRGLRQVTVHNFPAIDLDKFWDIVKTDIPLLLKFCKSFILP
ncbi:MAG: DUF86 domain-containing protein [Deltaproteobacteria bacterium]|jgi:uncharacterized protein with HEPN domain|nr:DUF86 domain-containing protein [Deltaproteobacteria bacterium]